jgi:hypothetical protein
MIRQLLPTEAARAYILETDFTGNVGSIDEVVRYLLGMFPTYGRSSAQRIVERVLEDMTYAGEARTHFDEQVAGQPLFTTTS